MTTITWIVDGNGNYEISSREHLLQLMNNGTLYTNAGSVPADYWAVGTSYIQTTDIDLLNDSTNIKPIGNSSSRFYGNYDGNSYKISNWHYLDPEFSSTTTLCEHTVGLFGITQTGVLKNIRLAGTFLLQGFPVPP